MSLYDDVAAGCRTPFAVPPEASVASKFKAAFRLEDREWERRVVSRGLEVSSQALAGLTSS